MLRQLITHLQLKPITFCLLTLFSATALADPKGLCDSLPGTWDTYIDMTKKDPWTKETQSLHLAADTNIVRSSENSYQGSAQVVNCESNPISFCRDLKVTAVILCTNNQLKVQLYPFIQQGYMDGTFSGDEAFQGSISLRDDAALRFSFKKHS